jgi:hypothetical protein
MAASLTKDKFGSCLHGHEVSSKHVYASVRGIRAKLVASEIAVLEQTKVSNRITFLSVLLCPTYTQ